MHPKTQASSHRDEAINLDASDPDFARSLRTLGAVQPNEIESQSSRYSAVLHSKSSSRNPLSTSGPPIMPTPSNNPALQILAARQKWQDLADYEAGEYGRRGFKGRELLDAGTLRRVLTLRDRRGIADEKIEEMLELKRGTVKKLGPKGLVGISELNVE